jgi:hypothetical protein
MNHPQRQRPSERRQRLTHHGICVSSGRHCRDETILSDTTTRSSLHLRFFATPASLTALLPSVSSEGTKLGLERSTSKMTLGKVATRASICGQIRRGGSLSLSARIKGRKRFRNPKSIQPPAHLAVSSVVGGTQEGAQPVTWNLAQSWVSSKGMAQARHVHQRRSTCCNLWSTLRQVQKRPAHCHDFYKGKGK